MNKDYIPQKSAAELACLNKLIEIDNKETFLNSEIEL